MARQHEPVRLRVVGLDNPAAAAAAFNAGDVDLAVARTDIDLPKDGQTLVILHRSSAMLIAPAGSQIASVNDLKGKRIGVLAMAPGAMANLKLLDDILARYGFATNATVRAPLTLSELPAALADERFDAYFAVGPQGFGLLANAVNVIANASDAAPVFVPMSEGRAIAQVSPTLEAYDTPRGAFGGAPPRPARDVPTISVTSRLIARQSLSDTLAGDVARIILDNRQTIAATAPSANLMETPSTDKGVALPTHAGAAAWIDGDQNSFMDKYSDYLYLGAMVLSVLASAAAALASRISAEGHAHVETAFEDLLARVLEGIGRARACGSHDELDRLERDADSLLGDALRTGRAPGRGLDPARAATVGLGLDQLRAAIAARRQALDSALPGSLAYEIEPPPRAIGQLR